MPCSTMSVLSLGIGGFATAFKAVVTDAPVTKSGIGSTTADTFNMSKYNIYTNRKYCKL